MKAMKLYDRVERIHNELALLDLDGAMPLTVEQLTPFDQYHYLGTEAVDEAIAALGLDSGMRVLDVGSGIGGPARYIAARSGARVTALELQPDLDALAADLTRRCGLADLVEHRCGNILDGLGETYDAVVSFLCFLHIEDKKRLLAACRDGLAAGGGMYIEDFSKRREPTRDEAAALNTAPSFVPPASTTCTSRMPRLSGVPSRRLGWTTSAPGGRATSPFTGRTSSTVSTTSTPQSPGSSGPGSSEG